MALATMLAIIDLTAGEILIILVFALIVLGPERLPEVARTVGHWMAKARKMTSHLQAEMRDVLDDPAMQPLKDVGEFVAQPRKKLTEMALAAEAEAAATAAVASAPEPEPSEPTTTPVLERAEHESPADTTEGAPVTAEETDVEPASNGSSAVGSDEASPSVAS